MVNTVCPFTRVALPRAIPPPRDRFTLPVGIQEEVAVAVTCTMNCIGTASPAVCNEGVTVVVVSIRETDSVAVLLAAPAVGVCVVVTPEA